LLTALDEALGQLERGPARAVVLSGQGSTFGAGVDLKAILDGGADYVRQFVPAMMRSFERLVTFSKPLVAAVNGHAIAGGAIIALACDQRLLARGTARFGLTEVLVGVQFPAWALEIARHTTPREHFATLILTGRTWPPEEALARGLVDELVEPEQLLERALKVAAELAAIPAATYSATKRAVRRPLVEAAHSQSAQDAAIVETWCSEEARASIEAFVAKAIGRKEK
jgi:enoyl-CoA hydratase